MHQRPERRAHVAAVAAAVAFEQPAQRAVGQRLQRRRRQRHDVVVTRPQRLLGATARSCRTTAPGSAPGTPASASRANCAAAQARTVSSTAPSGAQTTARSRADHRGGGQHPRCADAARRLGVGSLGGERGELVAERRRQHRVVALVAVDGGHQHVGCAPGRARRSAAGAPRRAAAPGVDTPVAASRDAVENVDEMLGGEHAAARNGVGPQPFLQPGDHHELPLAAERRVRADSSATRVRVRRRVAAPPAGSAMRAHVVDETRRAKRRWCG